MEGAPRGWTRGADKGPRGGDPLGAPSALPSFVFLLCLSLTFSFLSYLHPLILPFPPFPFPQHFSFHHFALHSFSSPSSHFIILLLYPFFSVLLPSTLSSPLLLRFIPLPFNRSPCTFSFSLYHFFPFPFYYSYFHFHYFLKRLSALGAPRGSCPLRALVWKVWLDKVPG